MKQKVNHAESGKATRRKESKEVNPFESEDCEWRRRKNVPSADGKYRANPFRAVENSIKEDSVSFAYEEAPADDDFIEAPSFEAAELSEKPSRSRKARAEAENAQESSAEAAVFESDENTLAYAPVSDTESDEASVRSAREKVKRVPTPAESEATSKKIWLIESVAAILGSFLALIVASIY